MSNINWKSLASRHGPRMMHNAPIDPEKTNVCSAPGAALPNIESNGNDVIKPAPSVIKLKADALSVLRKLLKSATTLYYLLPYEEYKKYKRLRSEQFSGYNVLCNQNSRVSAGWLLCKYAAVGQCKLENGLQPFDTAKGGTAALKRHTDQHLSASKKAADQLPVKLGLGEKRTVSEAAGLAVVRGLLPLSFADGKLGMTAFARAFFELGRSSLPGVVVDFDDLIPSRRSVRESIQRMASTRREMFRKNTLGQATTAGGVASSDLVLHYFSVGKAHILTGEREVRMECRVVLLEEHKGRETAVSLRNMLSDALMRRYGVEFEDLMQHLTFVTDCASTMPCIVGASSSSSKVSFSEKWVGCISHQINTCMKNCQQSKILTGELSVIQTDLNAVKTIVRIFKQGNWNALLPDGYALLQEVETRFSTMHTVVERFIKSGAKALEIISSKDSSAALAAANSLCTASDENGRVQFPALQAVERVFSLLRVAQTELGAGRKPTFAYARKLSKRTCSYF